MLSCFSFHPDFAEPCQVDAYLQESWRFDNIAKRPDSCR